MEWILWVGFHERKRCWSSCSQGSCNFDVHSNVRIPNSLKFNFIMANLVTCTNIRNTSQKWNHVGSNQFHIANAVLMYIAMSTTSSENPSSHESDQFPETSKRIMWRDAYLRPHLPLSDCQFRPSGSHPSTPSRVASTCRLRKNVWSSWNSLQTEIGLRFFLSPLFSRHTKAWN